MKFLIPKLACLVFIFIIVLFIFITIFVFPSSVFAKVIINEILPHSSSGSDWIELYNTESTEVDVGGWQIEDSTGTVKTFSNDTKIASSSSFLQAFVSNRLNNGGDIVRLNDKSGVVIDEKSYGGDPGIDISIGRYPDGSDNWGVLLSSTPNSPNVGFSPTFTPTPLPTSTSVPTKKPTSTPHPTSTPKAQKETSTASLVTSALKLPTNTPFLRSQTSFEKEENASSSNTTEEERILGVELAESEEETKDPTASALSNKKYPLFPILFLIIGGSLCIIAAIIVSIKKINLRQFL